MLNQLIISLTLILFGVNAFATETEKTNEQPKKADNEQSKKTEQDNPKPQTELERLREFVKNLEGDLKSRTTEKKLPDFQKIDALNDNNYCFIDARWLVLGRTEANQTVSLEIFARDHPEQEIKRDWLAGEAFMTWPLDALPVKDGAVYLVSINNDSHNLTLHQVADPRTINNLRKFYEQKWEKCQRQRLILKDKKNY